MLSVIVPVYNEAENIEPLLKELWKYTPPATELIFVDDGSIDDTWKLLENAASDSRVKCISLSRNFGHQHALMAGIQYATGDSIITMDGDLQHPPSLIPLMLQKLEEGYDIVQTRRTFTQKNGRIKKNSSGIFYKLINRISDTHIEPNAADFRAFNKKVLKSLLRFREKELFLRGIFSWIGFKTTYLDFEAPQRLHGETKYTYNKMLRLALKGTTSFGFKPLRIALMAGCIVSITAFAFAIFALISYFQGNTVPGWASIIIAIMLLGGTQLLAIGLIGEYIASLFIEIKDRPVYIVDKLKNLQEKS